MARTDCHVLQIILAGGDNSLCHLSIVTPFHSGGKVEMYGQVYPDGGLGMLCSYVSLTEN
jgi:hypothetical protein